MSITRVHMPPKDNNSHKPIPNPIRYACDYGHIHPSFRHAVKCQSRNRKKEREQNNNKESQ